MQVHTYVIDDCGITTLREGILLFIFSTMSTNSHLVWMITCSPLFGCFTPLAIRHTSRSDNSLLPGVKRVGLVHPPTKQIFSIFWGCSLYNMRKGFSRTNTLCWLACFLLPAFPEHVQHCAPCTLQRDLSRCQCGGKFLTRPPTLGGENDRVEV